METALIGILGAILGFTASYILEERKRKWERGEKRREWERSVLEKIAERYGRLSKLIYDMVYDLGERQKILIKIQDTMIQFYTDPGLYDDKLRGLHESFTKEIGEIVDDERTGALPGIGTERHDRSLKVLNLCKDLQAYINNLISQTYE